MLLWRAEFKRFVVTQHCVDDVRELTHYCWYNNLVNGGVAAVYEVIVPASNVRVRTLTKLKHSRPSGRECFSAAHTCVCLVFRDSRGYGKNILEMAAR